MVSQKTRFEVFKRDNFTCQYCGKKSPEAILEVDHITPRSKGGKDSIENLITSCRDCNRGKADSIIVDTYESTANRIYTEIREVISEQELTRYQIQDNISKLNELIYYYKQLQEHEFDLTLQQHEAVLNYVNEGNLREFTGTESTLSLEKLKSDIFADLSNSKQHRETELKKMARNISLFLDDGVLKSLFS